MNIPRTRKRISFGSAAVLLVGSSFLAQLLGFLRTRLISANFPATGVHSTDSYFAAFTIPDFFFFTIAAGALGVAFMPVLADHLAKGDKKGIWELSNSLLNMLGLVMLGIGVAIFVFAPQLMSLVAPKLHLHPEQLHDAILIVRLVAFNPVLFTISGVLTATQQTFGRFFFYALAPLIYNVSIIVGIFLFKDSIGLIGLGVGALAGAILQLVVVVLGMIGTGYHWKPVITWKSTDFRLVLRQLPPRSLDQGIDQLESIVETRFANGLGQGVISNYNYAYTLQTAPVLLIGTAISTAAFPRLNNRLSQGRPDLFRRDFLQILRLIVWITMPVVVIGFFGRGYLARLIFGRNSSDIAIIFGYLCVAIFFRTIYAFISRWFYAQKDTRTPLYVSIFTISFNVFLAYTLARPSSYGVAGLALAQSIVAATEVIILFTIMLMRDHKLFDATFWGGIFRTVSVTGFSLVAGYIAVSYVPLGVDDRGFVTLVTKLAIIAGVTIATHVGLSGLFGLEEVRPFYSWIKRIIFRPVKIEY